MDQPEPADPDLSVEEAPSVRRILVVDDNAAIHDDIRRILKGDEVDLELEDLEQEFFGSDKDDVVSTFEIDSAYQGEEGLKMVRAALTEENPYAMAFVDMRMPPGWDGMETIQRIWEVDDQIQVVICTAFSDYTWDETVDQLGHTDRLLILKKPFDVMEVSQMAWALSEKWILRQQVLAHQRVLETFLASRTESLRSARQGILTFGEELSIAKDQASAISNMRKDLIASASRDIQAQRSGVVDASNHLISTLLDARETDYTASVRESSDLLLERLSGVLDQAELDVGELELESESFELAAAVEEVVDRTIAPAAQKRVELAIEIGTTVPADFFGDRRRLQQILQQLLSNAIKFTDNGHVLVTVEREQGSRGLPLSISVEDSGVGIPKDVAAVVFDPKIAETVSPEDRTVGLPLAKRLVELMGGRLALVSQEGLGSVFTVQLPLATSAASPVAALPTERLRGVEVLAVSPRAVIRRLLHERLRAWGMRICLATSLDEGYDFIQESREDGEPIELLIVDQADSTTGGPELANALRDPDRVGAIPTVILGEPTSVLSKEEIEEASFAAYLLKPFRAHRLAMVLDRVMEAVAANEQPVGLTEEDLELDRPACAKPWAEPRPTWARVLVADDDEIGQKVAASMLRKLGCEVDVANDGRHTVDMMRRGNYDLLLIDCVMPNADGFTATQEIRATETEDSRTPIIAMASDPTRSERERCEAAGMDDCLSRPLRLRDLQSALERWLPA